MRIGKELKISPEFGLFQRMYTTVFGHAAIGLQMRGNFVLKELFKILNSNQDICNILDAGSGRGQLSFSLAKYFQEKQITGLEYQDELVKTCNIIRDKLGMDNLTFIQGDLSYPIQQGTLDLIFNIDCLEHIEDDASVVKHFGECLKQGGLLLIHVPSEECYIFGKRFQNLDIEDHVRFGYTFESLENLLKKEGFEILWTKSSYNSFQTICQQISFFITGSKEQNKYIYALLYPLLRILSLFGSEPKGENGTNVSVLAKKSF